jgi:hypothetical protein
MISPEQIITPPITTGNPTVPGPLRAGEFAVMPAQ